MQELENQSFRLSEMNWRRKNSWASSEISRNAKNSRDELICKAYFSAVAKHLTAKAKTVNPYLEVFALADMSGLVVDFSNKSVGFSLMIADAFSVEAFLNDPQKVNARINA